MVSETSLKKHEKIHDGLQASDIRKVEANFFKCDMCQISFSTRKESDQHISDMHILKDVFIQHVSDMNIIKSVLKCPKCIKTFINITDREKHIKKDHSETKEKINCKICGKLFSNAEHMNRRLHTAHEGHKDYKCEYCGKSYSLAHKLDRHIHTIHEESLKNFYNKPQFEKPLKTQHKT